MLLFGLVVLAERVVRRYFITRLLRRTHLEPAMQFALARVIGYALLGLGFYISLQMVGVNLTSLASSRAPWASASGSACRTSSAISSAA